MLSKYSTTELYPMPSFTLICCTVLAFSLTSPVRSAIGCNKDSLLQFAKHIKTMLEMKMFNPFIFDVHDTWVLIKKYTDLRFNMRKFQVIGRFEI